MPLTDLWIPLTAYVVVAGSPGPSNMAIMGTAMTRGRPAALALAAGVLTGSMTWAMLATTGVSTLLTAYAGALAVLKVIGGLYLLYLAFRAVRTALAADPVGLAEVAEVRAVWVDFRRGLLMHLTNPKAILGWVSIIALGVHSDSPAYMAPMIVIGCWLLGVGIFGGYALVFSHAPVARLYRRARRGIEALLAAVFGLAALRMLTAAT